ncbi:hypothetical protein Tco_1126822 [Tanacetum coccineum]
MDDSLIVQRHFDRAEKQQGHLGKSKTETRCKATMKKSNMREAVDAGLVVTEISGTTPDKQDTSSSSGIIPHKLWMQISDYNILLSFKGKTRSLVTKKTDISYVRSSRNSNLMNMLQIMSVHISSGLVLHLDVRSLLHDNIVPKPDLALELGKSISLTEAEEEAVAREVHATHVRIVSGPDPEPMQEDQCNAPTLKGRSITNMM